MTMQIDDVQRTPFQRRMEIGHEMRTGHRADFVHVSEDGILWHRVALCCGQAIPEHVPTFADHTPQRN